MALRPWQSQVEPPPCPEGWATGPPDFVGIGAQRSGTSWWYDSLRKHPRVEGGTPGKELHFFDWYLSGDPAPGYVEHYHALFPRPPGAITGEWTPRYMADMPTIRLLHEAAPDARLLVMLRDPIERYRSAAARLMSRPAGSITVRLAQLNDAVWRGFYYEQLKHVLELYPRERLLVLQFERCVAEPVAQMEATCRFLGLDPPAEPPDRLTRHRRPSHPKPAMPDWLRADLAGRYRDDVERLAELCPELDLSLWPSVAHPPKAGPVKPSRPATDGSAAPAEVGELDLSVLTRSGVSRWLDENGALWHEVRSSNRRWAVRQGRSSLPHLEDVAALVAEVVRRDGPVRRAIDVGSGAGYLSGLLAATGLEVHAVDRDPDRVAPVYERLGVTDYRTDIEVQRLPVEDGSFDLALLCGALDGLRADPLRPVRELARVLRPGGRAIVSVANITPQMRVRFLLGGDQVLGDPTGDRGGRGEGGPADPRRYSRRQLERMLEGAGLRVESVRRGGAAPIRGGGRTGIGRALSAAAPRAIRETLYVVAAKPPSG